jgi:3-phenylpropionate/cinnamic acid dioxygenase small subunit
MSHVQKTQFKKLQKNDPSTRIFNQNCQYSDIFFNKTRYKASFQSERLRLKKHTIIFDVDYN